MEVAVKPISPDHYANMTAFNLAVRLETYFRQKLRQIIKDALAADVESIFIHKEVNQLIMEMEQLGSKLEKVQKEDGENIDSAETFCRAATVWMFFAYRALREDEVIRGLNAEMKYAGIEGQWL